MLRYQKLDQRDSVIPSDKNSNPLDIIAVGDQEAPKN